MPGFVRDTNTWKTITDLEVRDANAWKSVTSAWVRDANTWKRFWGFAGFLRPDSDVETSDWIATPLWSKLDEVTADDATTEITSTTATATCPATDDFDFEVALSDPAETVRGGEIVTVRVRAHVHTTAGTLITQDLLVQLKELTTVRASQVFSMNSSYTTHSFVLSQVELDNIGNFNNLRVRCNASMCHESAGGSSHAHVTQIEVEFA